jgi:putative transposase
LADTRHTKSMTVRSSADFYIFANLAEARAVIERWRLDYNLNRPHSAHGGLTPDAARRRHADAAGRLRYLDGSAARPLQPAQEFGYNPDGLSQ